MRGVSSSSSEFSGGSMHVWILTVDVTGLTVRLRGGIRIVNKRPRIAASAGLGVTAALGTSASAHGDEFTVGDRR